MMSVCHPWPQHTDTWVSLKMAAAQTITSVEAAIFVQDYYQLNHV